MRVASGSRMGRERGRLGGAQAVATRLIPPRAEPFATIPLRHGSASHELARELFGSGSYRELS